MFLLRLVLKVLLLPVMLALFLLRVIINVGIHLSSIVLGLLVLSKLCCRSQGKTSGVLCGPDRQFILQVE